VAEGGRGKNSFFVWSILTRSLVFFFFFGLGSSHGLKVQLPGHYKLPIATRDLSCSRPLDERLLSLGLGTFITKPPGL
jgi:hypothetical protein